MLEIFIIARPVASQTVAPPCNSDTPFRNYTFNNDSKRGRDYKAQKTDKHPGRRECKTGRGKQELKEETWVNRGMTYVFITDLEPRVLQFDYNMLTWFAFAGYELIHWIECQLYYIIKQIVAWTNQ